jgi:hypothetical protein
MDAVQGATKAKAPLLERGRRPQLPPLVSAPIQRAAKVTGPVDQATLFDRG